MNSEPGSQTRAQAWLVTTLADGPRESAQVKALAAQCGIGTKALRKAREYLGLTATRQGSGATMRSVWALSDQAPTSEGTRREEVAGSAANDIRAPAPSPSPVARAHAETKMLRNAKVLLANAGIFSSPISSAGMSSLTGVPLQTDAVPELATVFFSPTKQDQGAQFCSDFEGPGNQQLAPLDVALAGPHTPPLASRRRRLVAAPPNERAEAASTSANAPLTVHEHRRVDSRIELFVRRGMQQADALKVALALVQRDRHGVQAVGSCIECQNFVRRECSMALPTAAIHTCWSRRHDAP